MSQIEQTIKRIPPTSSNYEHFVGLVRKAAKTNIPRGIGLSLDGARIIRRCMIILEKQEMNRPVKSY